MNGPFRRQRRSAYFQRTTGIAAENLGPGDWTLQRIRYLNFSEGEGQNEQERANC
jgi:hypothetical protein